MFKIALFLHSQQFIMNYFILAILLSLAAATTAAGGCYTSLFGFGDSLTDTGNICLLPPISGKKSHICSPPYGENYFRRPTGRSSDGRLIIDFLAEYFDIPLVPPSLRVDTTKFENVKTGVNFAVVASPVLDFSFYAAMGLHPTTTIVSLKVQLKWFKQLIPSLCDSPPKCREFFQTSLIMFGPLGGNDYTLPFFQGKTVEEVRKNVPLVAKAIGSALTEIISLGAVNIMVPGILPFGCLPSYLNEFKSSNSSDYDENGCLIWPNNLTKYHDELVLREIERVRELNPQVLIIYADFYNAAMELYGAPTKYGFKKTLEACCDGWCGDPPYSLCHDPSSQINFDGSHLSEVAYRLITGFLIQGRYTNPPIKSSCLSNVIATS